MADEAGNDEKILAVPMEVVRSIYADVHSYQDLPLVLREQIGHFFFTTRTLNRQMGETLLLG